MGVYSPVGENLRYRFTTLDQMLSTTVPLGQPWRLVDAAGATIFGGFGTGSAPTLHDAAAYTPFASMDDGGYGYSIDSGAAIITEDSDGLLVEMTPSTSWEITLTGFGPTTGAHFLLQALHLWATLGVPSSPAAGDEIFARCQTDANNYSQSSITYDGANWQILATKVASTVQTDVARNVTLATDVMFGMEYATRTANFDTYRTMTSEYHSLSTPDLRGQAQALALVGAENIAAPNAQKVIMGGSVGAGATWTVRLRGLRPVEHFANTPGAPF